MNFYYKYACFFLLSIIFNNYVIGLTADNTETLSGNSSNYDQPLFLTPYIENGDIETGRHLSRVGQLPNAPNVPSYSGLFTVNKEYNSNLFFWFFPALNNDVHAPLILWIPGGPGASSFSGPFLLNGPYKLYNLTTAVLRNNTWAKEFNMIYVDSPVGAGFSFTDDEKGYSTNQEHMSDNLYKFLEQFFVVYYEYRQNDFYVCGSSYAGRPVPNLAYKIHLEGPPGEVSLKGICLESGVMGTHHLKDVEKYLFQLGIIDSKQADVIKDSFDSMEQHLKEGEISLALTEAINLQGNIIDHRTTTASYLTLFSGYESFFDLLRIQRLESTAPHDKYMQSTASRRAIHVGNLPFQGDYRVQQYLMTDSLTSSSVDKIAFLLDYYKVLMYYGQQEILTPYVNVEKNLLRNMSWNYSKDYTTAERKVWRLDNEEKTVAGYARSGGNLFSNLVRNAGHLVARDQPEATLDLITRFIKDIPCCTV